MFLNKTKSSIQPFQDMVMGTVFLSSTPRFEFELSSWVLPTPWLIRHHTRSEHWKQSMMHTKTRMYHWFVIHTKFELLSRESLPKNVKIQFTRVHAVGDNLKPGSWSTYFQCQWILSGKLSDFKFKQTLTYPANAFSNLRVSVSSIILLFISSNIILSCGQITKSY